MSFILLGILNSQAAAGGLANSYDLLASTVITGGGTTSVTFSNLNTYTDYKHLQIRWSCRFDTTSTSRGFDLRMNGDGGANYTWHYLQGEGSGVPSGAAYTSQSKIGLGEAPGTNTSNLFAAGATDILDFSSTNKHTTTRTIWGMVDQNSPYNRVGIYSGVWRNTAAVTSLSIQADNGVAFVGNSRISLYGVK